MIVIVNLLRWLTVASLAFACSCQSPAHVAIRIIDGNQVHEVTWTGPLVPATLMERAGVSLALGDTVLFRGYRTDVDRPISAAGAVTLQVRRAVSVLVNGKLTRTSAQTVGEALAESGATLYAADQILPPSDTPISDNLIVTYVPSREFSVAADRQTLVVRSSAASIQEILSQAGLPLIGLDFSQPAEDQPAPQDGKIRVIRVSESIVLAQKALPFQSQYQASSQVELDHEQVLQPGQTGLAVTRTRVRYEDGQEVTRAAEAETVVRAPVDRVVGYGTQVVVHSATVDGSQIQYWRTMQMFATAYSPCNSAADRCYPGTSSGKPVEQGVVAVKYSWYLAMQGQALYIPGYGRATIEDVCGGCVGKPWIDLGYTDTQFAQAGDQWGKYVTVYFLAPPPASITYVLP